MRNARPIPALEFVSVTNREGLILVGQIGGGVISPRADFDGILT